MAEIKNLREKNKNNIFLLGGDFNLPDIDWTSYDTHSNQIPAQVNQAFIRMTADLSVQQLVNKPTRGENTLDLMFTSHPGHLERCKTLPPIGNSDHDIVLLDLAAKATRPKPTSRTINLWKKANMEGINKSLTDNFTEFQTTNFSNINAMWNKFKSIIMKAMTTYVPTKQTKERYSHPWMNTQLRKISNSKQRAYTKAKRTKNTKDWKRYKFLKAKLQKESHGKLLMGNTWKTS